MARSWVWVWVEGPHFWRALTVGIGPQDILVCIWRSGKDTDLPPVLALYCDPLVLV